MKRIEFNIKMRETIPPYGHFQIEWDGYAINDVPGLAVSRPPKRDATAGLCAFVKGDGWRVVHIQSGQFVGLKCINLRKEAVEFARMLGAVGCDWTQPYDALSEYAEQVKAAIREFLG